MRSRVRSVLLFGAAMFSLASCSLIVDVGELAADGADSPADLDGIADGPEDARMDADAGPDADADADADTDADGGPDADTDSADEADDGVGADADADAAADADADVEPDAADADADAEAGVVLVSAGIGTVSLETLSLGATTVSEMGFEYAGVLCSGTLCVSGGVTR